MKEHAQLPWHVNGFGGDFKVVARMQPREVAISTRGELGDEIETASLIVRAVNSHAALLEALEMALVWIHEARDKAQLPVSQTIAQIRKAIANATGEA